MRLIYLDESGTSNNGHEPWLIVAGIIVHGDNDGMDKAEGWIAKHHSNDLARVFWEDGSGVKPLVRQTHKMLFMDPCPLKGLPNLPAKHLSGPAYFVDKKEDRLMQLADICAFCIKKKVTGSDAVIDELHALLEPQLVSGPFDPVPGGQH